MQKATMDQPATNQHGALYITTTLTQDGIYLHVADAAGRIADLSKGFTDREQAAAFYRHVAQAAEQGKRVYQIVWEIQALEEAQQAATRTDDELAAAIDHTMRQAEQQYLAPRQHARAQAETVGNTGWAAYANRARTNTRPTSTDPLTPLMQHALTLADRNGEIRIQPGVTARTLRGMANRSLGRLVEGGPGYRRYEVVKLVLNQAGRKLAEGVAA